MKNIYFCSILTICLIVAIKILYNIVKDCIWDIKNKDYRFTFDNIFLIILYLALIIIGGIACFSAWNNI